MPVKHSTANKAHNTVQDINCKNIDEILTIRKKVKRKVSMPA